jgi:endonuclease/exonuclease/phosphatase family metal-dependent hydrolase
MRVAVVLVLVLVSVVLVSSCKSARLSAGGVDAGADGGGDDVVRAIGSTDALDVGAWNLKNFPCGNASDSLVCRDSTEDTPALVASIIRQLDVDLLAVEEIDDEAAFDDVVAALPGMQGVLSPHEYFDGTYQKVGFIWKTDVLDGDAADAATLFDGDDSFPRPPLLMPFTWKGAGAPFTFDAVAVHLKAGGTDDDVRRRRESIAALDEFIAQFTGAPDVVILGDYNERVTDAQGESVFAPFEDAARYDIRTQAPAAAGAVSFIPSGAVIDHIVTTRAVDGVAGAQDAVIPRIDADVAHYLDRVSDHLPVFLQVTSP